jgi:hypothetical protein
LKRIEKIISSCGRFWLQTRNVRQVTSNITQ